MQTQSHTCTARSSATKPSAGSSKAWYVRGTCVASDLDRRISKSRWGWRCSSRARVAASHRRPHPPKRATRPAAGAVALPSQRSRRVRRGVHRQQGRARSMRSYPLWTLSLFALMVISPRTAPTGAGTAAACTSMHAHDRCLVNDRFLCC